MFEGHKKVAGGPHVARGQDVAQALVYTVLKEGIFIIFGR